MIFNFFGKNLQGMCCLSTNTTQLPVIIWVDENGNYEKGSQLQKIRFQLDHSDYPTNNLASMLLDGTIPKNHLNKVEKSPLNSNEIKQIQTWVYNNYLILSLLAEKALFMTEFKAIQIPGGKYAEAEQIHKQKKAIREVFEKCRVYA
jgi:hypothetical protein